MTFEALVKKAATAAKKLDASAAQGHLAVEFGVNNEDCGGAFYVEVSDGEIKVEGYDYKDFDVRVETDADTALNIISGKADAVAMAGNGEIITERNTEALGFFKAAAKAPAKKTAEKKPAAKKAGTEKKPAAKKEEPEKKPAAKKEAAEKVVSAVKEAAEKKAEPEKKAPRKTAAKKADMPKKPAAKKKTAAAKTETKAAEEKTEAKATPAKAEAPKAAASRTETVKAAAEKAGAVKETAKTAAKTAAKAVDSKTLTGTQMSMFKTETRKTK